MSVKMTLSWLVYWSCMLTLSLSTVLADERDADEAAAAALGQSADEVVAPRPAHLPDLTKGDPMPPPPKGDYPTWNMGPVGIIGIKNHNEGDQIRVISVVEGSPAQGKMLTGDVILGVEGQMMEVGRDINRMMGDAIIKAEEEFSKGLLTINIWRDRNWLNRTGSKDVFGVDIDKMFKEAQDSSDVYEWKNEEEKTASVTQMGFDKYPIDGFKTNITVQLEVMGTYSDDSPWDCPVVTKVRENAWKIIASKLKNDLSGRGRNSGSWPDVLALVASGKPEYVELAKQWVHSLPTTGRNGLCQDMNRKGSINDVTYRGMQSWHHGFNYLEMAIYYDATGDKFILPEIRKRAICAAMGQNGGGSWGHTFAFPEFNGGMLHGNNPGYGAMNNAGTRCFFLLTLAKKFGIEDPEINAAIARADRFFSTFVDKGCIPYGYHSPWPSDDSNGKNYGAAYAFYTLGEKYKAKFFGMHSANAAFTRRGGHASPTLWYYTPLSANLAGPKAVKAYMRNMRHFYTLSRNFDGSFVFLGDQTPGIGGKGMRNPTATVAMHLSYPLHQLIITGKDADPAFWMTDEEYEELLISAHGMKDPALLKEMGTPWNERSTDEVIGFLDHYYPKFRSGVATELATRYTAGEKDIVNKLLAKLSSDEARMRAGACEALGDCGADVVLSNMSRIVALLKDEAEFVRMTASKTIGDATAPGDPKRESELLKAVADDYPGMTMDNGNVRNAVKDIMFPRKKKGDTGPTTLLITEPFKAGYNEDLVRNALERIVTMDPQGTVPGTWSKETLLKLAGPVTFTAEELQLNDAMFGGARKAEGQALLLKHGYQEAVEGNAANLMKRSFLDRDMRMKVTFKDANITPKLVKVAPGRYREILDDLHLWQQDDPVMVLSEKVGKDVPPIETPLSTLIEIIEKDTTTPLLPSIVPDVAAMFQAELAQSGDDAAKLALCRKELENLDRKNYFRKMDAMTYLVDKLGIKAIDEVSPFLGHTQWRLREHANKLTVELVKNGSGPRLIELLQAAQARESGLLGNLNAAAMMAALVDAQYKPALAVAKAALKHKDPVVRKAAVQTVFAIGGDAELKTVFEFMLQAKEPEDLQGCELALLSKRNDPVHVQRVSAAAIKLLPDREPMLRRSLAWILGQFGGAENLAALQKAAAAPKDDADLKEMVLALAYSPDRGADKVMLSLVKQDQAHLDVVSALSVHRMVGRNGAGDVTDAQRMDLAEPILRLKQEKDLITYLGKVHTGRSIQLLYEVMQNGGAELAAPIIINTADGMEKAPAADRAMATDALAGVIEYIEVTRLRGGAAAHMDKDDNYAVWKGIQAQAGKVMLKVHKPKAAAIPQFDDRDLDL